MAYMPTEDACSDHEERFARFDIDYPILRKSAYSGLTSDILKMLNNPDSSDMTFMCQDGVKVYACRMLLVSRSSMLRNMLTNGMAESQQSEVVLHEITSPVLLIILEFIYSGWIKLHSIQKHAAAYASETPVANWKMMLETIRGARFFLLKTVEDIIIQKLWTDAKSLDEPQPQVAKAALRLSIATEFMASVGDDNTKSSDLRVICIKLVKILQLRNDTEGLGSVSDNLGSFSERAFQFFLQNSQNSKDDDGTLSIDEYKRFRQVVLWCATQALEQHGQLADLTLPTAECARSLLNTDADPLVFDALLTPLAAFSHAWEHVKVALTGKLTSTTLEQLLSMIDLKRIHPELLIKVIENLGIFPSNVFESAFRLQALARSRLEKENQCLGKRLQAHLSASSSMGGPGFRDYRPPRRKFPWGSSSPFDPDVPWAIDSSEEENSF
ncbi:hypothetical protein Mapa_015247 [Marchantia paleacea]|nr:hypothetical protein Mapa_015247 [Marchantia paleacea]